VVCKDCVQSDYWNAGGKTIPVEAWTGPVGSRRSSAKISWHLAREGGKVISPMHRLPLPPKLSIPGTHFC